MLLQSLRGTLRLISFTLCGVWVVEKWDWEKTGVRGHEREVHTRMPECIQSPPTQILNQLDNFLSATHGASPYSQPTHPMVLLL